MKKFLLRNNPRIINLLRKLLFQPIRYFVGISIGRIAWYKLKNKKDIKIELGSGAKSGKNGWTTVDIGGADIYWDLRHRIPLKNETVSSIYSSHLLEHIPYKDMIKFLNECWRILKFEGEFSICVPNVRNYINAYIKNEEFIKNNNYWKLAKVDTGSKLDQINYMAYMGGEHKYMFDKENLINTILKSNFKEAKLRKFDPNLDLKGRDFESIYAVAYKK